MEDSSNQLAIHGGPPVFPEGPPGWPLKDEAVREALEAAWGDGSWGRYDGPHGQELQAGLRELVRQEYVTLCSSGTIGVELALRGVGIGSGDEVFLAAYDFPGNFRAVEAVGARPVLVDIVPNTWCLDAGRLEEAVDTSPDDPKRRRAVVVSHLHGGIAAMGPITELADRHRLVVVEDACQAPGATVEGRPAGASGHAGVFSFGGSKLLTAGRGGAVVTGDATVHQRMRVFAERGNLAFPFSELQAAVLKPQLKQLEGQHAVRAERAAALVAETQAFPDLRPLHNHVSGSPAYYKLPWCFAPRAEDAPELAAVLAALQAEGVAIDAGFRGFAGRSDNRCRRIGNLHAAKAAAAETVLLHHPVLLESEAVVLRVASAIEKVLSASNAL